MVRFLVIILLFFQISVSAQDAGVFPPDSAKRSLQAIAVNRLLTIDGQLNEPEWMLAKPSPRFIQIEPVQNGQPAFETEVKVLYNRQYLYVGIISHDSLGKKAIRATDFKRDFDYRQHDLVTLTFDGFNDKRNAMLFATNAYGVQRDLLSFDDLYYDLDWDGLWRVRTTRTDTGWVAEIAIPWQTLRYPKSRDSIQHWGFNLYRNRRLTNEITAFSPFPRIFSSCRMDYAGEITGLKPPPPGTNIRVLPYFLTTLDRYHNPAQNGPADANTYKIGGELKWAISTNAVLDATVNTDFAQADADLQVNNTTQFSVLFPEKRQFFLENASLFAPNISQAGDGSGGLMQIQPFFSRSIGLDTSGRPIPILAGGRYVYRSTKLNYGAILMRQLASGTDPATNFFVGRFSDNFGKQNRIGTLVTVKNSPTGSNVESTVDGFFRLGEAHSLNTILTHSVTTATGKQGFAGFAQYYFSTLHYKIWLTQSIVTKDFDPQMGFVSRKDVIGTTPGMNWYYRGAALPFKKLIRAYEPGFLPELYWQASTGKFIERDLYFWPIWINFQSGAYFGYSITPSLLKLENPFAPLGVAIPAGEYRFTRQGILATTDPSKMISLMVNYTWGAYYNGRLNSGDWKLQFAPVPYISLTAEFNRNHFMGVGQPAVDRFIDLYILQGRFALNPRLQLICFYQQNALNNTRNYNIRFSWEYQPLSYIYLIYNHGGFTDLQQSHVSEDHVIAKISYLRQF